MRRWWLCLILCLPFPASACLNYVGTEHTGEPFSTNEKVGLGLTDELVRRRREFFNPSRQRWRNAQNVRTDPSFRNLNNYGVSLIYSRMYSRAIALFIDVEKRFPGRYETAANLGTVYELVGKDELALRWIRLGIQRNAESHYGTEWLHVRILEAKLAEKREPGYLSRHSIAGVVFSDAVVPPLPSVYPEGNDGKPVSAHGLHFALSYQMHERIALVPRKDRVVANLLQDWATLNLSGGSIESARELYRLAERYGAKRTPLVVARLKRIDEILAGLGDAPPRPKGCPICRDAPD